MTTRERPRELETSWQGKDTRGMIEWVERATVARGLGRPDGTR